MKKLILAALLSTSAFAMDVTNVPSQFPENFDSGWAKTRVSVVCGMSFDSTDVGMVEKSEEGKKITVYSAEGDVLASAFKKKGLFTVLKCL